MKLKWDHVSKNKLVIQGKRWLRSSRGANPVDRIARSGWHLLRVLQDYPWMEICKFKMRQTDENWPYVKMQSFLISGTRIWVESEIQRGQIHNRAGPHDKRKWVGVNGWKRWSEWNSGHQSRLISKTYSIAINAVCGIPPRLTTNESLWFHLWFLILVTCMFRTIRNGFCFSIDLSEQGLGRSMRSRFAHKYYKEIIFCDKRRMECKGKRSDDRDD